MENQNVIIFLDKIKKLIELGNKPKAISEIEIITIQLERQIRKKTRQGNSAISNSKCT